MAMQRLNEWWRDDPDRMLLDDPDVQRLAARISPAAQPVDLGGVMSLNVWLDAAGLVLRVHQPFVSRARLLALQQVRRALACQGLRVPAPVIWQGKALLRCRNRWAELEEYLPHGRPTPTLDAYRWLFAAMGGLHCALAQLDQPIPRPLVATYAPPGSLQRWLRVTEQAVQGNSEAAEVARLLRSCVGQLRRQWLPAHQLPQHWVHGDVRLSNLGRTFTGETAYLDFGFLAWRPRIHELAYSLAFMLLALEGHNAPESFAWENVPRLVTEYETAAQVCLTQAERRALAPYTAAVSLYAAALDGFTEDPIGKLRSRSPFLRLSEWLLANATAPLG